MPYMSCSFEKEYACVDCRNMSRWGHRQFVNLGGSWSCIVGIFDHLEDEILTRLFSLALPDYVLGPEVVIQVRFSFRPLPSLHFPKLSREFVFAVGRLSQIPDRLLNFPKEATDQAEIPGASSPSCSLALRHRIGPGVVSMSVFGGMIYSLTASTDSMIKLGRLKKNFDRSNTPNVVRSFCALEAFSKTGRNTWFAFMVASVIGNLGD